MREKRMKNLKVNGTLRECCVMSFKSTIVCVQRLGLARQMRQQEGLTRLAVARER